VVALLTVVLVRNKVVYAYDIMHDLSADGLRYASSGWQNSDTIHTLRAMDPELIYTDDLAAVYLLAGRTSYLLPLKQNMVSGEPRADYPQALSMMRSRLSSSGGMLVLFRPHDIGGDFPSREELTSGLSRIHVGSDGGEIYVAKR
jgi:hypothetical protein